MPRLFHKLPVRVRCASCASEAVALIEQEQPDLLISDYKMPGMNGLELLEQVRARWPQVRSVLNTGEAAAVKTAQSRGFAAVFKPEAPDALVAIAAEAIARKTTKT
jgi:two-component system response regulator YesN